MLPDWIFVAAGWFLLVFSTVANRAGVDIIDLVKDPRRTWSGYKRVRHKVSDHTASEVSPFLTVGTHRHTWSRFAVKMGWKLDLPSGHLTGVLAGQQALVVLPRTYLGGPIEVRLTTRRLLPKDRADGTCLLPPSLAQYLNRHRIELEATNDSLHCTVPTHDVSVVGGLLELLATFLVPTRGYRMPAVAE